MMKKNATPLPALTFWPLFWKAALLSLLFAAMMLLVTAFGFGVWGYGKFRQFLHTASVSQRSFMTQIKTGWQAAPVNTRGHKNLLILGTDSVEGRGDVPPLTDTMMLISINLDRGTINTLPLPRDLWSETYQTKINAFYAYGFDRTPEQPEQFSTTAISELTGVPIHHTLILSLNQLETLIDLVDGVEITVATGFTDPLFPRQGVNVATERDPAKLYESITFVSGPQTLSGQRALQYIRSRHSEDEQGHDLARGQRQQQVIAALLAKLTNYKALIANPKLAGELYHLYERDFSQALPLSELVSTAHALLPHRGTLTFASQQLTDIDDDPVNGVLDNPPLSARYQNQWVYVIDDEPKFQAAVQNQLYN